MTRRRPVVARLAAAVLAVAGWLAWSLVPDRHKPWVPLTFEEPPGWLTRYKLAQLDGNACRRLLETTPFVFSTLRSEAG
jgi:hypothetical protein